MLRLISREIIFKVFQPRQTDGRPDRQLAVAYGKCTALCVALAIAGASTSIEDYAQSVGPYNFFQGGQFLRLQGEQ